MTHQEKDKLIDKLQAEVETLQTSDKVTTAKYNGLVKKYNELFDLQIATQTLLKMKL